MPPALSVREELLFKNLKNYIKKRKIFTSLLAKRKTSTYDIGRLLTVLYFCGIYEASRFAAMGAAEQYKYIRLMTTKVDIKAQIDYKYEQGMEKGAMCKAIETARNFKANGVDAGLIAKCTGLTVRQVEEL